MKEKTRCHGLYFQRPHSPRTGISLLFSELLLTRRFPRVLLPCSTWWSSSPGRRHSSLPLPKGLSRILPLRGVLTQTPVLWSWQGLQRWDLRLWRTRERPRMVNYFRLSLQYDKGKSVIGMLCYFFHKQ